MRSYGSGRLQLKHELAQRVCKGSWMLSAKTAPVKAQGSKNRNGLASLKLGLEVTWPDVTSSYMESFSPAEISAHLTQVSNQFLNF